MKEICSVKNYDFSIEDGEAKLRFLCDHYVVNLREVTLKFDLEDLKLLEKNIQLTIAALALAISK